MRIGIDFGTTRVVVAAADRGNYPVVTFDGPSGEGCEWFPSVITPAAAQGGGLLFGHEALVEAARAGGAALRSLKRRLPTLGPEDRVLGLPVPELLTRFAGALREALLHASNLGAAEGEPLEVAIAVPANAPAAQRMVTADAFARAGFAVLRILDEPSAAGLEYAWRRPSDAQVRKRHVAVYDLGGGTFDASVIAMSDARHEVLTTEGVNRLGGDDFDELLLELACAAAKLEVPPEGSEARRRALERCREEKEKLGPSTKRLSPDLGAESSPRVAVEDYDAALRPLVERSLEALDRAIERAARRGGDADLAKHTVVYQVGGASQLPVVGRALRERFGRRVWRSPYPHASVAIGLAIAAAEAKEGTRPAIEGGLTRHFGVFRERDAGRGVTFDPIFEKDTPLGSQEVTRVRRYRAQHNVGHYRFVECSRLEGDAPAGDVTPWSEVRAPLAAELCGRALDRVDVRRLQSEGDEVEERYRVDVDGVIAVEIRNLTAGYGEIYRPVPR